MTSQIHIFVYRPSGALFEIPVIPPKIQMSDGSQSKWTMVLGVGETVYPGYRSPNEVSWDSFFPYQYDPGYCQYPDLLHPQAAKDFFIQSLLGTQVKGRPDIMHVKITDEFESGQIWPIVDDFFMLQSFNTSQEESELTDLHYTISFKAAKLPVLKVTDVQADITPPTLRKPGAGPSVERSGPSGGTGPNRTTYTVRSGDSLSAIAASQLGDMARWRDIYNLNIALIGPDPDLILPGQILTMPAIAGSSGSSSGSGKPR